MFSNFPDAFVDYCSPIRLESIKSILYNNPVNSTVQDVSLLEIKCSEVKIQSLFCRSKTHKSEVTSKIPFCHKPEFQSEGIPCTGLEEFILKDSEKMLKEKENFSYQLTDVEKLAMPKLFNGHSKYFKKTVFDEKFAFQVNLNQPTKPFKELIPNPAWGWPFELDMFQKRAIIALENSQSVFVAAHTSAGKTVVAEYAIAMCHNRGARVIYTSPIKALSNQKYREFKMTFGNEQVGLLTGDIKTGANRYILVMTTEILHNMLKNDCNTLRDLEVVIMDEVHYLNDDSRGHIWEQIMILLPKNIQLVMLSATVPNTMQFAEWLGRIRKTQIQVISTFKRPVPLEIYLFTATGRNNRDQFYRIMDSNKNFLTQGYQAAEKIIKVNTEKLLKKFLAKPPPVNGNQQNIQIDKTAKHNKFRNPELKLKPSENYNTVNKDHNQWLALFEALKEKNNLPVICFLFSRNRIQSTVSDLRSIDLLSQQEKSAVKRYFKEIIGRKMSNPFDKKLPQVLEMQDLLMRGVAMHHAGLLPLLKEIVEILFSQNYVKILFATETFAVGVNMPARSVVFDSIEKHDGSRKRLLLPGEFTQMAGRAGRRGLDEIGTVIILVKPQAKIYSQDELKRILIGSASQLESKFKISYNMILSLYRNRQFNIQHMIRHSFIEADRLKKYDENCIDYEEISEKLKLFNYSGLHCIDKNCNLDMIVAYYKACREYRALKKSVDEFLESKNELQNLLSPGRLILLDSSGIPQVFSKDRLLIPAVVLALIRQASGDEKYKIRVLTHDLSDSDSNQMPEDKELFKDPNSVPVRPLLDKTVQRKITEVIPKIMEVTLNNINKVCQMKIKVDVQEIDKHWLSRFFRSKNWSDWINDSASFKNAVTNICEDVVNKLECANYDKELNIKDARQRQLLMQYFSHETAISSLCEFSCIDCFYLADHMQQIDINEKMLRKINVLQQNLSDENLIFLPEYRNKVALLKNLDFLNPVRDTIKLKGRIACEIESYEIIVTEMILSGVFLDALPCDIAACLSSLMYESKSTNNQGFEFRLSDYSPPLQNILKELFSIVEKINTCQDTFNILGNEIQINCGLVESVRLWTSGSKFSEIVEITEIQSGDVIRCLQRICELLRHCESAAKVMGNFSLAALFKTTQESIYRGVVSTSSLYVDDIEEMK